MELEQRFSVDQRVCDFHGEEEGLEVAVLLLGGDFRNFIVGAYAEKALDYEHCHDNAEYAKGIRCGIAVCHCVGGVGGCLRSRGDGLLCGGEAGSIGHSAAEHAHQCSHIGDPPHAVDGQGDAYVQGYGQYCQGVEPDASLLERREEAGTYLQADGEDKEDKAELAHELKDIAVDNISEMPHQNADKKHKGDAERYAEHLYLADEHTKGYHERVEHQRVCQRGAPR